MHNGRHPTLEEIQVKISPKISRTVQVKNLSATLPPEDRLILCVFNCQSHKGFMLF